MGAIWDWYRFEYASMRDSIHFHGLAKLRDDPALCKLSEVALNGHNAQRILSSNKFELQQFDNLERAVYGEKVAQDEILDSIVNSIVTAKNNSPACEGEWDKPDIHPC